MKKMLLTILAASLIAPAFANSVEEPVYPFLEMNCTGTLSSEITLPEIWKSIALRIVNSPREVTDGLGQRRVVHLFWNYTFGKTIEKAKKNLDDPNQGTVKFTSPGLALHKVGNNVVVTYADHYYEEEYLHLNLKSSTSSEAKFLGTFMTPSSSPSHPDIYNIECTASLGQKI